MTLGRSTAMGRLLLNLLASLAEFELEMIRERVIAGMDRASGRGDELEGERCQSTTQTGKTVLERFWNTFPLGRFRREGPRGYWV